MMDIEAGLPAIPIIYLIIVYFTPLKFDMNLFLVFCGATALFMILGIINNVVKSK